MFSLKRIVIGILSIALVTFSISTNAVNAESVKYEKVTWNQLNDENFDVDSVTEEDVHKAEEVSENLDESLFKEDQDGFATMDISSIEEKYGNDIANVFKLGLANINLDIDKGISKFASDHKSFIKGPNYDKYVNEDNNENEDVTNEACTTKGGAKAIVGGAAAGAVGGAIGGGGAGALPGGVGGGATGAAGYYATCWW